MCSIGVMIRTYLDNTNIYDVHTWIIHTRLYMYIIWKYYIQSKCILPYMDSMGNVNIAYMDPNIVPS